MVEEANPDDDEDLLGIDLPNLDESAVNNPADPPAAPTEKSAAKTSHSLY